MGERTFDNPYDRDVLWVSPTRPAVALRYERKRAQSAWRISGMIASSRGVGLGSGWMKRFQWRGLGDPLAIAGIAWLVTPTIALVDAVFDENEELKSQWEGDGRPPYLLQDDRETEDRLYFRRAPGIDFENRADLEERLLDLVFDDAAENDVIEIRREHFYKTVAGIYRSASRGRGNPVSAVAKAYDAPRTSAANWVREARVRGYLPPTTKGRAT